MGEDLNPLVWGRGHAHGGTGRACAGPPGRVRAWESAARRKAEGSGAQGEQETRARWGAARGEARYGQAPGVRERRAKEKPATQCVAGLWTRGRD